MICPKCGAELPDGSLFCNMCGEKIISDSIQDDESIDLIELLKSRPKSAESIHTTESNPIKEKTIMHFEYGDRTFVYIKCGGCGHKILFTQNQINLVNDNSVTLFDKPVCPYCGGKSNSTIIVRDLSPDVPIICPKCGSTQITANKKGFGLGKAVVGTVLTGGLWGAGAGLIGSNKVVITCLKCGHQWKPGK